MKKFFTSILLFFRHIRVAWLVSRDPEALVAIGQLKVFAKKQKEFDLHQEQVKTAIHDFVVNFALPNSRHEMKWDDPRQPLLVKMRSKEVIGSCEADQILEESHVDYKFPSDNTGKSV